MVSGGVPAQRDEVLSDSIRPFAHNPPPRSRQPITTHHATAPATAEEVGQLRPPAGGFAPANPGLHDRGGANPYLTTASRSSPAFDPFAPANPQFGGAVQAPAAPPPPAPSRPGFPSAMPPTGVALPRNERPGSGAYAAATASRPSYDPGAAARPPAHALTPIGRPSDDPFAPQMAPDRPISRPGVDPAVPSHPYVAAPAAGVPSAPGVARPGVPISRPGLDVAVGRPVVAQRPGAIPVSRPSGDLHAPPLGRPVVAQHPRSGDAAHPIASVPSADPWRHPHAPRPPADPDAGAKAIRALVNPDDADFRAAISHLALAGALGEAELAALAGTVWRCSVAANQVLFAQGDHADNAYLLSEGLARVEHVTPGKPVEAVGSVKQGDVVGEAALVGGDAFPFTVAAGTACTFLAIGGAQFAELQRSAPAVAVRVLAAVAAQQVRRLRADGKKVDHFAATVLGVLPPAAVAESAAPPSTLGRLFNRLAGGKEEP